MVKFKGMSIIIIALVALLAPACGGGGDDTPDGDPGITVDPTSGLRTTESGGRDTFTVVLDAEPMEDVVIALSSSDETEGTVSPAELTFTVANWNAPQDVTVTGVDDDETDGDVIYTISTAAAVSDDQRYNEMDADNVEVTNTDDESAGITVDPTDGLETDEDGGTDTFDVVLNTEPTADVTIALSSSDEEEGTVSPGELTFTPDNWDAPQDVTVTGVDDDVVDGDQVYEILTAEADSADARYDGLDADDVEVTNLDNDTAGITVDPTEGLETSETGGSDTFDVVLDLEPTADVVIALSSSDEDEGTVSPESLTFTPENWNAPQEVTVTGVDDDVADGDQVYTILTAEAVSDDGAYDGLDADDVEVTNADNDSAGITVAAEADLETSEDLDTATFTIVLDMEPTADVVIGLSSDDEGEGTVLPVSLTFTSDNWDAPQTVTVTGVDDDIADGNQVYNVLTAAAVSDDDMYDGADPDDVEVTNIDNDTPGVTVAYEGDLETTEAGAAAAFTVVLITEPTADVVIGLSSDDEGEGTVLPVSLTFTSENWNAPQTVTVTGVDDDIVDGNQAYNIVTAAAVSEDEDYNEMAVDDVEVTNIDDDSAGIIVAFEGDNLSTSENETTDTFTVVLVTMPSADVVIGISSDDEGEGTVSADELTFTPENWNAPQTVTVTGVDDDLADGNQTYTILTAAAVSEDSAYADLDADNVPAVNADNDSAGITVVYEGDNLSTSEDEDTDTFTVVLNTQPTNNVVIGISSDDEGEGVVDKAELTFTFVNWNAPQTVTVTGVDDEIVDGNQPFTVLTAAAVSDDSDYSGMDADNVPVVNADNDTAGIRVSPTTGLITTESGGTDTFTVVLLTQPSAGVTIGLHSSDTGEGTIDKATLTFTSDNWSAPQTVAVTGVDDVVTDGNQPYTIVTDAATSGDGNYSGINADDVSVTNTDNDTPGITVIPTTGLSTTESGRVAVFSIRLNAQPTANVTIPLSSSDEGEGTIVITELVFTPANWAAPQYVEVTGVDDEDMDGDQVYYIRTGNAVSDDSGYSGLNGDDVEIINHDNDTPGITVQPITGLVTTEDAGTDTFTIVLMSQPEADVRIDLSSNDEGEGTVDPPSVTFTSANWESPQTVTVKGVNDDLADGNQPYRIDTAPAVSGDAGYNGLDSPNVLVTNIDNDSEGIIVEFEGDNLTTTENEASDTFTMVLTSQPTHNVAIGISSSDETEGTVSAPTLTFTPVNWNAPQTITVTGVDDSSQDGNQTYTIVTAAAMSVDPGYNTMNADDVPAINIDNDTAGITVGGFEEGIETSETGTTDTFSVVLNTPPLAEVRVPISSADTSEGVLLTASPLVFTTANWNAPQVITVQGVDDDVQDGDVLYTVRVEAAESSDTFYNGIDAPDVPAINYDNDEAGITVQWEDEYLITTEAAVSDTFTVVLDTQPTANVAVPIVSLDLTEGTVDKPTLTFTPVNWNAPQTVAVTGVNDDIADGNQHYVIQTQAAVSSDGNYSGMNAADVPAINNDNDSAGITVTPTEGLITTEALGSDTFIIVLNSQPLANVTIGLSSTDVGEGTVSTGMVTFTTANWNAPQTITVTGVDDDVQDGNQPYRIATAPASSSDGTYNGMDPDNVAVVNIDNDSAGISVDPTSGLETTESGGLATTWVVLTSQPGANVTIPVRCSDATEGSIISTVPLVFTPANWSAPQAVTVRGLDDDLADGNQLYTLITDPAVSGDSDYNNINPDDVSVTNIDNDSAGIIVDPTSGLQTTEDGGDDTFTVELTSQPTADVTIPLRSGDTSEGTVTPPSVTFTSVNWAAPQTVTVHGINDDLADGNQVFTVLTDPATSGDGDYNGMNANNVSVTNIDNDSAGILVGYEGENLTTTESGGQDMFGVVLTSQPTANVTIGISSSDVGEGTVSAASLTFTPVNWAAPQFVDVTGVDDVIVDGNQPYTIVTAAAVSGDPSYSGMDAENVPAVNIDNDSAGVIVDPEDRLTTTEDGGVAVFTIVLTSQPSANVTIGMSSSDTTEGTISTGSITFTPANWFIPIPITMTGVNDDLRDGDQVYYAVTAACVSGDSDYSGLDPVDAELKNTDNDSPGITVTPTSGIVTHETGTTDTFTIVLNGPCTDDVIINLWSSDLTEGAIFPADVTFTTGNWSTPVVITVLGIDDFDIDGDQPYTIVTDPAISADPGYDGFDPFNVTCVNLDNEVPDPE